MSNATEIEAPRKPSMFECDTTDGPLYPMHYELCVDFTGFGQPDLLHSFLVIHGVRVISIKNRIMWISCDTIAERDHVTALINDFYA